MPLILAGRPALTLSRIPNLETEPLSRQRADAVLKRAGAGKHQVEAVRQALVEFAQSDRLDFRSVPIDPPQEDRSAEVPQSPRIATARIPVLLPAKSSNHACPASSPIYVGYPLPPSSILKPDRRLGLPDGIYLASPALVLLLLARRLSWSATLVCALELCGTYDLAIDFRPSPASGEATSLSDVPPASTPKAIGSFLRGLPGGIPGLPEVRIASELVVQGSASPMESRLFAMLAGPVRRGGYGVRGIELNGEIRLDPKESRLLGSRTMRVDLLHRGAGIGIEYDSRQWHEIDANPDRIRRDKKRIDIARYHDINLMPLTWDIARNLQTFDTFCNEFRRLIGLRNRKLSSQTLEARSRLHRELFGRRGS